MHGTLRLSGRAHRGLLLSPRSEPQGSRWRVVVWKRVAGQRRTGVPSRPPPREVAPNAAVDARVLVTVGGATGRSADVGGHRYVAGPRRAPPGREAPRPQARSGPVSRKASPCQGACQTEGYWDLSRVMKYALSNERHARGEVNNPWNPRGRRDAASSVSAGPTYKTDERVDVGVQGPAAFFEKGGSCTRCAFPFCQESCTRADELHL